MLLRRRKTDSDMHYQALQAEYSEGLLARNVSLLCAGSRHAALAAPELACSSLRWNADGTSGFVGNQTVTVPITPVCGSLGASTLSILPTQCCVVCRRCR